MERNNISDLSKNECNGCTACISICPKNCITMKYNDEGFLYPIIDKSKCINCGLCGSVCQAKQKTVLSDIKVGYASCDINYERSKDSSSGGIFFIIASMVLEKKGFVCGAIVDSDLNIKHILSNKKEDIEKMRGSKYVQSDLNDCFSKIKRKLDNNILVLFCGTPCQVRGLQLYLRKSYNNLILVDLICHGVPSPKYLKSHLEKKYGKLKNIKFREKNLSEGTIQKLILKYNKKEKKVYAEDDAFYSLFLKGYSFRECCYICRYASNKRCGDITIGDCASTSEYKSFEYGTVLSTVLINTYKGIEVFDKLKDYLKYEELNTDLEVKKNQQLHAPFKRPNARDTIYSDYSNLSVKDFENMYLKKANIKKKIRRFLRKLLPLKLKGMIKQILRIEKR